MGNKKSSGYCKKRKFCGNQFPTATKKAKITDQSQTTEANTSASAQKISAKMSTTHTETKEGSVSGFRLVDLEILKGTLELLPCSNCLQFSLQFLEDPHKWMGCASYLYLRCSSCEWTNKLYTSKLTNNFETY